jgi:hypothetical protein
VSKYWWIQLIKDEQFAVLLGSAQWVETVKQENGKMTAICKSLREDISSACESMITMMEKSDYLVGQSWQQLLFLGFIMDPH